MQKGTNAALEDFATQIFMVAHEMHWTIDYIIEMPPWMLKQVALELKKYGEEQESRMQSNRMGGGLTTLG